MERLLERLVLGSCWMLVPLYLVLALLLAAFSVTAVVEQVQLAFVVSALILAFVDRIAFSADRGESH